MRRSWSSSLAGALALTLAASTVLAGPPAASPNATAAHPKPGAAAASGTPTAAPAAPSADGATADPVRKLFEEGTADLNAGKSLEAAEKLRAVWQQKKTYDVAGNLGAALLKLGRPGEAARFVAHGLASYPAGGKPSGRQRLEELLSEAKGKAAEVRLAVSGGAAAFEVRVDGAVIEAGLAGPSLFVEPGARVIEVSAKGYVTARQTVDGKAGQAVDVALALVPERGPAERSLLGPGITFGVGGVGLVVGAIAAGVSFAKFGELEKACGPELACAESLRGEVETGRTLGHVSTAAFVVAGVGAAVGVTLLLLPPSSKPPANAGMVVGPGFVGVKGAF